MTPERNTISTPPIAAATDTIKRLAADIRLVEEPDVADGVIGKLGMGAREEREKARAYIVKAKDNDCGDKEQPGEILIGWHVNHVERTILPIYSRLKKIGNYIRNSL